MFSCFGVLEIFIEDLKNLPRNKPILQIYQDDTVPIAPDALLGTGHSQSDSHTRNTHIGPQTGSVSGSQACLPPAHVTLAVLRPCL